MLVTEDGLILAGHYCLQLIMRKLRRHPNPGRAGVVVPNGTLYASGVAVRIRKQLIEEFNLHTVVRLPKGVFEPYADIPTNILFFTADKAVEDTIWFYEHPLPPNRAKLKSPSYSLTDPLQFEEFQPLIRWWNHRVENRHAWRVPISEVKAPDWNLDQRNPRAEDDRQIDLNAVSKALSESADVAKDCVRSIGECVGSLADLLVKGLPPTELDGTLGDLCKVQRGSSPTMKTAPGNYPFVVTAADKRTADRYQFDCEAVCIPLVSSTGHGHAAIHRIHYASGQFALANIMAAIIVREGVRLSTKYLYYYLWRFKEQKLVRLMAGTANTSLTLEKLSEVRIEAPSLEAQERIVSAIERTIDAIAVVREWICSASDVCDSVTEDALHASMPGVISARSTTAN